MSEEKKPSFLVKFAKAMLPVAFMAAGGVCWAYFKTTAPVIPKAAPQRQSAVVRILTATTGEAETFIRAMGTVSSSREVTLKARVSGTVISVSDRFVPGGRLAKGEVMLTLDPSDYEVAVKKAQSALLDAQAALAVEQGNQTIAREELRLLTETSGETVSQTDLALRKPQLQQAQAAVESARANLRQAQLNLNRTAMRIPFNAMILERSVNLGAYVSAGESLAFIADTDEYWVKAMVALDQVSWIDMDRPGGCPGRHPFPVGQRRLAGQDRPRCGQTQRYQPDGNGDRGRGKPPGTGPGSFGPPAHGGRLCFRKNRRPPPFPGGGPAPVRPARRQYRLGLHPEQTRHPSGDPGLEER